MAKKPTAKKSAAKKMKERPSGSGRASDLSGVSRSAGQTLGIGPLLASLASVAKAALGESLPKELISQFDRVVSQSETASQLAGKASEAKRLLSQIEACEKGLAAKKKQSPTREKAVSDAASRCGQSIFEAFQGGDLQSHHLFSKRLAANEELKAAHAEAEAAKAKPGASLWARTAAAFKSLGPSSRIAAAKRACEAAELELAMQAVAEDMLGDFECKSTRAPIGALRAAHKLLEDGKASTEEGTKEKESLTQTLKELCGAKRKDERTPARIVTDFEKSCTDRSLAWWVSAEDVLVGLIGHLDEPPAREQRELLDTLDAVLTAFSGQFPGSNQDQGKEAEWLIMHEGREQGPFPTQQVTALINGSVIGRDVRVKVATENRWRLGVVITHFADSLKDAVAVSDGGLSEWPTGRKATVQITIPAMSGPEVQVRLLCDEREIYTFRSTTGLPRFDHDVTLDRHVYVLECPQPMLGPTSMKNYPVTCRLAGHYRLEWDNWPNVGTQLLRQVSMMSSMRDTIMPWGVKQTYVLEGTTRLAPSPKRQRQFVGLWEKPGDSSQHVLVTEDGWILMPDGESAKYSWLDRDTVIFEADEDNDEAVFKVASLTDRELALVIEGQILHFRRGQTLSDREAARLRAEQEERAVILRAKAKAAAAEVGKGFLKGAAVLALVSVAAVGAVAVAAASAGGSGGGAGRGSEGYGGGSSGDSSGSRSRGSSPTTTPVRQPREEPPLGMPTALSGCVMRRFNDRTVIFSHKCEYCGWVDGSTFSQSRVAVSGKGVSRGGFVCGKCKKQQPYEIAR